MVISKGRVLVMKKNKAVVEIGRKKVIVNVRPDVNIKVGDIVVVAFNTIVDKLNP
jgi:Trk K+ transport system NAD-binding subunit